MISLPKRGVGLLGIIKKGWEKIRSPQVHPSGREKSGYGLSNDELNNNAAVGQLAPGWRIEHKRWFQHLEGK